MKLTKFHRELFVSAVMVDVPKIDYQSQFEARVNQDVIDTVPPTVAAMWKDLNLRPYLTNGCSSYRHNYAFGSVAVTHIYKPSEAAIKDYDKLKVLSEAQDKQRNALEAKLDGVIFACSTLKQAQERLPEFIKYLPAETEKTEFLPAIANLAADLMQAGWKPNLTSNLGPTP